MKGINRRSTARRVRCASEEEDMPVARTIGQFNRERFRTLR